MPTKLTFHEIHSLGWSSDEDRVTTPLPFEIMSGVTIEDVSSWLNDESLGWVSSQLGFYQTEALKNVRFALVHRYFDQSSVKGTDEDVASEKLVRNLIELVHIIRPMRQRTSIVYAELQEGSRINVGGMDIPNELEVPEVQKLNHLRDKDLQLLKLLTPIFIGAMQRKALKFNSSIFYYAMGRLQPYGNARYLLWCSAIEALFTSHNFDHQGKLVATERIKWFLGSNTSIYEEGDIPDFISNQPTISVGDVVDRLYTVRNYIAHGDVIPNEYFVTPMREGVAGDVATIEVLSEAASFIARQSLLRILKDGLLHHFENAVTADAYFLAHGLTKPLLKQKQKIKRRDGSPEFSDN
jgi:hypothetical protein